jgi:catechol 2,3-dioxygenase-like lactoylglutathione lyase family enzyme
VELFAGMPVRDLERAKGWYSRLLGAEPSFLPNASEAVWTLEDQRHVYVVVDAERAGGGHLTLFVGDLAARADAIARRGIEPTSDETYSNGVRKLEFHDPDGNRFGLGGRPQDDPQR